jgi:hypothetical protein
LKEEVAMGGVKDELRQFVEVLSEEEAMKTVDFVRQLRGRASRKSALDLLQESPAIRIPTPAPGGFPSVRPVRGTGTPASRLLIEDRR